MKKEIILASSSPFRRQLLEKLALPFRQASPDIDESRLAGETVEAMVMRLAEQKARKLGGEFGAHLIIGSDELAVLGDTILGKPLTHENAMAQLRQASGKTMRFVTGLCLYNSEADRVQVDYEACEVDFRELTDAQIDYYLRLEQPYQSAGSIKAEGLAVALFRNMRLGDPNALIGLPLVKLVGMLAQENLTVLSNAALANNSH